MQHLRIFASAILGVTIGIAFDARAGSASSDLDGTFGEAGRAWVSAPFGTNGFGRTEAVVARSDGSLVVLEQGRLRLVSPQGSVDTTFGYGEHGVAGGCVSVELCAASYARPHISADDTILVPLVAYGNDTQRTLARFGVIRLRADGKRDAGFGVDGIALLPPATTFDYRGEPAGIAVNPRGEIIVAGIAGTQLPSTPVRLALARFLPDGRADTTFGVEGLRITDIETPQVSFATLGDGSFAVAGNEGGSDWFDPSFIAKFLPSGDPDPAFGVHREPGPTRHLALPIALDADGSVIVVRRVDEPLVFNVLSRILPNGLLDPGFGIAGRSALSPADFYAVAGIAIDSRRRIVIAGYIQVIASVARVSRFHPDGRYDETFVSGAAKAFWEGFGTSASAIGIAPGDRIVIASGVQTTYETGARIANWLQRTAVFRLRGGEGNGPAGPQTAKVVEYFNASLGHYFITPLFSEQRWLGSFSSGWEKTGRSFTTWVETGPMLLPACRFFSDQSFAPKSSHFFTPYAGECAALKAGTIWKYEGDTTFLRLPEGAEGARVCPIDTQPLYRAYNNGMTGAPNHRYTIDAALLDQLIAQGWIFEGEAQNRIFACVPLQ